MKMNNLFTKFLILFFITFISIVSCSDDDKPTTDPDPDPVSETAVVAAIRVSTPGGRVYYMGAYSEIPEKLDFADMVELGGSATINSFGENPFVWNGISSTLTKYEVSDQLEIKVSDVLSFASTGLSGGFGLPTFVSETQAYFFALSEGKVIEFNPTTMKIIETIAVDVLALSGDSDINTHTYSNIVTEDGLVILPIGSYPDGAPGKFPQYAELAVFDPATKAISYVKDTRMSMGYDTYAKGDDGSFYYRPSKNTAISEDYGTITDYPTTGGLLKIKEDGTFDSDFFVDLKEVVNAHSINSVVYVSDNKALVQYLDASFTPPTNPDDWYSEPTNFALVDLVAKTFEPFTSFEEHGTVYTIGQLDGVEYYGNLGDGNTPGKYSVLKQNGPTDFEVVSDAEGSLIHIGRLR